MEGWQVALIMKPIILLILFGTVRALTFPLYRWMPEGKLKRILFFSWRV